MCHPTGGDHFGNKGYQAGEPQGLPESSARFEAPCGGAGLRTRGLGGQACADTLHQRESALQVAPPEYRAGKFGALAPAVAAPSATHVAQHADQTPSYIEIVLGTTRVRVCGEVSGAAMSRASSHGFPITINSTGVTARLHVPCVPSKRGPAAGF